MQPNDEISFDIEKWVHQFPLDDVLAKCHVDDNYYPAVHHVTSPFHIAMVQQIRARVARVRNMPVGAPCDVFAFGLGEPLRRDITKIGGLPFRSANRPWPIAEDGGPMTFLCQFRFAESQDIVPDLPGDLLLVFCTDESDWFGELHFEWHSISAISEPLIEETPLPRWQFSTFFGQRYRTVDYFDDDVFFESLTEVLQLGDLDFSTAGLGILHATKIGGVPSVPLEDIDWIEGRYICSLGSIQAVPQWRYPFLNRKELLTLDNNHDGNYYNDDDKTFTLVDMGCLTCFLCEDGSINTYFSTG